MGQKVHPTGIRLGIIKDWTSTWYADSKNYAEYLNADMKVRDYLRKKLVNASVSRIQIERPAGNARQDGSLQEGNIDARQRAAGMVALGDEGQQGRLPVCCLQCQFHAAPCRWRDGKGDQQG